MTAEVQKLRERISSIKSSIAELQLDRLTRAETEARLTNWVDSQAQQVNARALVLSATEGTRRIDPEALAAYGSPQADGFAKSDMAPFFCWLDPESMKKRLLAELEGLAADHCSSQKAAARKAALTKAQSELDDLERKEEAAIVEAEQQGQIVPRRHDCRPEIVLALPETDDA